MPVRRVRAPISRALPFAVSARLEPFGMKSPIVLTAMPSPAVRVLEPTRSESAWLR